MIIIQVLLTFLKIYLCFQDTPLKLLFQVFKTSHFKIVHQELKYSLTSLSGHLSLKATCLQWQLFPFPSWVAFVDRFNWI